MNADDRNREPGRDDDPAPTVNTKPHAAMRHSPAYPSLSDCPIHLQLRRMKMIFSRLILHLIPHPFKDRSFDERIADDGMRMNRGFSPPI